MAGVHNPNEMQMAPADQPGARGSPVQAMDTSATEPGQESQAATGQGQTGAGHARTQILRAPGYPTGDDTVVYKVRHRIPIQLEPTVPEPYFYNTYSADGSATESPYNTNQPFLFSGWLAIPVSSIATYMNDKEIERMYTRYQAYRYLSAGLRMSNFQTHSVLPTGQDTPGFALNNSGVTFYSVQMSSRDLNYPWLLGSQQFPSSQLRLSPDSLAQTPAAFDDGDGTTRAPQYRLRPRNVMPTGWWLWWLARVDVATPNNFAAAGAQNVERFDGFSVIPDLQRLALEQQNSPVHAAWFYRFNAEKQWRSRNLVAQAPNQFFNNQPSSASVKTNTLAQNMKFLRRDVNVPYPATNMAELTQKQPVYVTNYGMMISGMQARGPPTWNSFYERIFNINDVPLQKYGDAWTFADQLSANGKSLVQSNFGVNGQGYGLKGIKDLWAIAWRVPNDPAGSPVPLTIEFVMETQIDVECKHFDAETDLNGIICRPNGQFTESTSVDTVTMGINQYDQYMMNRGFHMGFKSANDAPDQSGMMVVMQDTDMPHQYMMPQSSFSRHIALESDNWLTRLDGAVQPGGLTNYGNGWEAQNAINRSRISNKALVDMSNNANNVETLMTMYHGQPTTAVAP